MSLVAALVVIHFLYDSKPSNVSKYSEKERNYKQLLKKDELNVMTIMIFKVMMYYFQTLAQVLSSQSITHSLLPLMSFFSLSLDYSSSSSSSSISSICIIPFLSSPLLKILCYPIFVGLLLLNLFFIAILNKI